MIELLEQRIREKIRVAPSGCWEWTAARDARGYGRLRVGGRAGRTVFAHRHVYTVLIADPGPLPLDHLCRNPSCVAPTHLEPVTTAENTRRGELGEVLRAKWEGREFCSRDHPMSGKNLYVSITRKGYPNRQCKECRRIAKRALYARQRAALQETAHFGRYGA